MGGMDEKIKEVLERGVLQIYPSREALEGKLRSGEKLTIYNGIDPTGPSLHIGHGVVLLKLKQLQELGHRVILLIGDYTGLIGDPTGKDKTRPELSHGELLANSKRYKEQASRVLDAEVKYNSEWLGKLTFADTVRLASQFTVGQMIERDMFQERLKAGRPIYLHEFLYPLMQGYDSVAMDVDMEVGGSDQIFNMLAGRALMKNMKRKEKFVLGTKLLTDPSGKKMGKTEGNMISFDDDPADMYGKAMSWPDEMIELGFELCTRVPLGDIDMNNPRDAKMRLAREIVSLFSSGSADEAERRFVEVFQKKQIPGDVLEIRAAAGDLGEILVTHGVVSSKSEFGRLVGEGAVSVNEEKIQNPKLKIQSGATVQVGKRRFVKITVEPVRELTR
ncbi:MAG: tyrosine--tRNA ligase [Parcubacteria group bacterium]|nr:tyrosine--tRNA ligase [Parcubacteria group bacterium]